MGTDDEVGLLEGQYAWEEAQQDAQRREHQRRSALERFGYAIIVACSFVSFIIGVAIGPYWAGRLDSLCLQKTSIPYMKVSYHEQNFNSTLFGESVYRQKPGPVVDQAWIDLGVYFGVVLVDEEKALKSGITRGHVKTSVEEGGKYFVNVEAFHQLHCLNLLRKTNHWNYDYYQALGEYEFKNEEHFLQLHADHCLDSLREQLMCTADIGVLPYVRIKGQERAYPDFPAAPHMCRNFDDIHSWVKNAQLGPLDSKDLHNVEPGDIILDEIP